MVGAHVDAAGALVQHQTDVQLLLNLATNTQRSGADTSFWAGPGTYFLKVNATGDWKLDVQDLR